MKHIQQIRSANKDYVVGDDVFSPDGDMKEILGIEFSIGDPAIGSDACYVLMLEGGDTVEVYNVVEVYWTGT